MAGSLHDTEMKLTRYTHMYSQKDTVHLWTPESRREEAEEKAQVTSHFGLLSDFFFFRVDLLPAHPRWFQTPTRIPSDTSDRHPRSACQRDPTQD